MTMPTIEARTRHAHRVKGKFAPRPDAYVQHLNADAFPDDALQAAARDYRAQSVDMPDAPIAWSDLDKAMQLEAHRQRIDAWIAAEPVERETWRDVWADVQGVVLCAGFVLCVLAFGSHAVGMWGQ